jgi:hypothetical protein
VLLLIESILYCFENFANNFYYIEQEQGFNSINHNQLINNVTAGLFPTSAMPIKNPFRSAKNTILLLLLMLILKLFQFILDLSEF